MSQKTAWPRIINEIQTISERIIKSVREISYNLRPQELEKPLKESVRIFCTDFAFFNNIAVDLKFAGLENTEIDNELETAVFKMVHECMFNVVRHSKAEKVVVHLMLAFPDLIIRVEDNGIGFNPDYKMSDKYNLGLRVLQTG